MATEKKLDCVILGLLSHEELTGYDIKKQIDVSLKYFWGASYGSIYPTLSELVHRGLATKRASGDSRRTKLIYTITKDGQHYLSQWLKLPIEKDELRYETLLKLFFGSETGPSQAVEHVKVFQDKIEKEIPYLIEAEQNLEKHMDEEKSHKYYLLTVKFGIKTYGAYLEWCKEAKEILEKDSG